MGFFFFHLDLVWVLQTWFRAWIIIAVVGYRKEQKQMHEFDFERKLRGCLDLEKTEMERTVNSRLFSSFLFSSHPNRRKVTCNWFRKMPMGLLGLLSPFSWIAFGFLVILEMDGLIFFWVGVLVIYFIWGVGYALMMNAILFLVIRGAVLGRVVLDCWLHYIAFR